MQNLAEKKTTFSQDIPFISMCFNINTSKCAILPKGKRLFCKILHFFLSQENIHSFSILFALFFSRVQGGVDCNAVRRARGKLVLFSEKKSGRRHLEFFHEKTHHRTPWKNTPSRKKAMRGSTGFLDMNKKPCHPSQNNKIFFP